MCDFDIVVPRRGTNSLKWDSRTDLLPLWVADMDFRAPKPVIDAVIDRARHGVYGYAIFPDSYFAAIANWLARRHGWTIQREWITFCPGVVPALNIAVQTFTQPGDKVIVQPPVYYPFFAAIEENGRRCVANNLVYRDGYYSMDFEDLEEQAHDPRVKLLILCSPHNPVGRVWSRKELERLGQICLDNDIMIVSDEIHCDIVCRGKKHVPIASLSEALAANSITCMSPSKTFNLAGLQTAYAIIPDAKTRDCFAAANKVHRANVFGLEALIAAYDGGEAWLESMLDYVEGNLQFLRDVVAKRMPKVRVVPLEGTYLAWLDCAQVGLDPGELDRLILEKARVWLDDGPIFGPGGAGFQRINLACPRSILEKALERLEEVVRVSLPATCPAHPRNIS